MRGAVLELAVKGSSEKERLFTGNPDVSFFSMVQRRQFFFGSQLVPFQFGTAARAGGVVTANVPEGKGDLLGRVQLEQTMSPALSTVVVGGVRLPETLSADWEFGLTGDDAQYASLVNGAGQRGLEQVEWCVDGFQLDRQTAEWMQVRDQLFDGASERAVVQPAAGWHDGTAAAQARTLRGATQRVPLRFSFCENWMNQLPLFLTDRSQWSIRAKFRRMSEVWRDGVTPVGHSVTVANSRLGIGATTVALQEQTVTHAQLVGEFQVLPPEVRRALGQASLAQASSSNPLSQASPSNPLPQASPLRAPDGAPRSPSNPPPPPRTYLQQKTGEQRWAATEGGDVAADCAASAHVRFPDTTADEAHLSQPIELRHAAKEFIWGFRRRQYAALNDWSTFGALRSGDSGSSDDFRLAWVEINGTRRVPVAPSKFFRQVTTLASHTSAADTPLYSYSFALQPEAEQPSGTLNLSKLNGATFHVDLAEFTSSVTRDLDIFFWAPAQSFMEIANGIVRIKQVH